MTEFKSDKAQRAAQKTLAYEVTKLVHGKEKADSVRKITSVLFGSSKAEELDESDFEEMEAELPSVNFNGNLVEALVKTGLASSNTEARRFVQDGAVYINGQQIKADTPLHWPDGTKRAILRRGKNNNAVLKLR
jgi:tyrosyl-tRNA synthetase